MRHIAVHAAKAHAPARVLTPVGPSAAVTACARVFRHAQLGPRQGFTLKWATGHQRVTSFVVVHEANATWLSHPDFKTFVSKYIADALAWRSSHIDWGRK